MDVTGAMTGGAVCSDSFCWLCLTGRIPINEGEFKEGSLGIGIRLLTDKKAFDLLPNPDTEVLLSDNFSYFLSFFLSFHSFFSFFLSFFLSFCSVFSFFLKLLFFSFVGVLLVCVLTI